MRVTCKSIHRHPLAASVYGVPTKDWPAGFAPQSTWKNTSWRARPPDCYCLIAPSSNEQELQLKRAFTSLALAATLACTYTAAQAEGCTKGAVVGGVAGHVAGDHGVAGAAAGCAIGHHEAKKKDKEASAAAGASESAGK
jgi:hypothetical protein